MADTLLQIDASGRCVFSCWTPFAGFCHGAFIDFWLVRCFLTLFPGVIVDSAFSWGWITCFHDLLDVCCFDLLCFFHDVLYSAFMTHHFWSTLSEGGSLYRGLIALSSCQGRCFTQLRFVWYFCQHQLAYSGQLACH